MFSILLSLVFPIAF